jgi:predicted DNA-binding protein
MVPFSLRITQLQKDRLDALSKKSGLSVQEHIRRGVDEYLAVTEPTYTAPKTRR